MAPSPQPRERSQHVFWPPNAPVFKGTLQRDTFHLQRALSSPTGQLSVPKGPFGLRMVLSVSNGHFGTLVLIRPVSKRPFFGFEEAFSALKGLFGPCHDLVCPKTYNFYSLENVDPLKIVG